jgi:hypothetical protein
MRDDRLSVDAELIAFRLAAEDRVVVEHEAASALPLLEEHGSGEPADAAAHDDEIVRLAGVDRVAQLRLEGTVANGVRGVHHVERVAIGARVIADAAVAGPFISGREHAGHPPVQPESTAGDERGVDEIAAGDRLVHAEPVVVRAVRVVVVRSVHR